MANAHAVSRHVLLDVGGGTLVAAAAAVWRPPLWILALGAGACFAAWHVVRALAATVGIAAALLLAGTLLFRTLGTWIS